MMLVDVDVNHVTFEVGGLQKRRALLKVDKFKIKWGCKSQLVISMKNKDNTPRSVCNRLVSGQAVIAETFQSATIYFR